MPSWGFPDLDWCRNSLIVPWSIFGLLSTGRSFSSGPSTWSLSPQVCTRILGSLSVHLLFQVFLFHRYLDDLLIQSQSGEFAFSGLQSFSILLSVGLRAESGEIRPHPFWRFCVHWGRFPTCHWQDGTRQSGETLVSHTRPYSWQDCPQPITGSPWLTFWLSQGFRPALSSSSFLFQPAICHRSPPTDPPSGCELPSPLGSRVIVGWQKCTNRLAPRPSLVSYYVVRRLQPQKLGCPCRGVWGLLGIDSIRETTLNQLSWVVQSLVPSRWILSPGKASRWW